MTVTTCLGGSYILMKQTYEVDLMATTDELRCTDFKNALDQYKILSKDSKSTEI